MRRRLDHVFVSRLVAAIALAVLAASPLAGTHVHDYADHDHSEHHHGPAAHSHERHGHDDPATVAGNPRLAPCDPGEHEVSLQAACTTPTHVHIGMPAVLGNSAVQPYPSSRVSPRRADVRVHGPPGRTAVPPRAPPVVHPA